MKFIYQKWWKVLSALLIIYSFIAGYLGPVPRLPILHETIRNIYFHVPMWIGMFTVFFISVVYSVKYLRTNNEEFDLIAVECVNTGLMFFGLGLASGVTWAYITWGEAWSNDPKENSAAIAFLLYCAYAVLRNAIDDDQKRARVSSIYNIFCFPILLVLLIILPRLTDSLHPGNGGNPAFGKYLSSNMKMVLYPAFIGWALMAIWIASLRFRIRRLSELNQATN